MRNLIGVAVAVAGLLVAGMLTGCGGGGIDVGVSPSAPVGTMAGLEKVLLGKGLKKEEGSDGHAQQFFGDWAVGESVTLYKDAVPSYIHAVAICHKDGKPLALAAKFRSQALIFSTLGTKCESFTARLWQSITGGDPVFKKLNDPDLGQQEYLEATANTGKVACTWRKDSQDQNMNNSRGVVDLVRFKVN